ncbi:MAG: hypothetical protein ACYC28_15505 [Longimicrobiales bacterium]
MQATAGAPPAATGPVVAERYSNGALLELRSAVEQMKPWEQVAHIVADMASEHTEPLEMVADCERTAEHLRKRGPDFEAQARCYELAGELLRTRERLVREKAAVFA